MEGRLSIIVPCGRPETARGTVESILAQDALPADHEIVLAGVSVEPLIALCTGRANAVPAVLPRRGNPGTTRMAGVAVATGRHLLFVDDDIDLAPGFLRELDALLAREDNLGAVGARLPGKESAAKYVSRVVDLANFWSQQGPESGERDWLYSATLYMPADVYHKIGGFNPALAIGEDVDLTQRVRAAGYRVFYAAGLEARHNHRRVTLGTALRYFWTNGGLARHLFPPGPALGRLSPSGILRGIVSNCRNTWTTNRAFPGIGRYMPAVALMYLVFNVSLELHRHWIALEWMAGTDAEVPTRSSFGRRLLDKARAAVRSGRKRAGLALYLTAGALDPIWPGRGGESEKGSAVNR